MLRVIKAGFRLAAILTLISRAIPVKVSRSFPAFHWLIMCFNNLTPDVCSGFHFHFCCQFSTLNRTWNGFSIYRYTLIELYHNQIWEGLWRLTRVVDFRMDFCMEYISGSERFCKSQSLGTNTLYPVIFRLKARVKRVFLINIVIISHSMRRKDKVSNGNLFYS